MISRVMETAYTLLLARRLEMTSLSTLFLLFVSDSHSPQSWERENQTKDRNQKACAIVWL